MSNIKTQLEAALAQIASMEALMLETLEQKAAAEAKALEAAKLASEERRNSVVQAQYKRKYAARAASLDELPISKKAAKRSCCDWLAFELGKRVLDEDNKLIVEELEAIFDANGVKHRGWNRTTNGWQGRLRMSGSMALRRIVAEANGELKLPDGEALQAPAAWVAANTH